LRCTVRRAGVNQAAGSPHDKGVSEEKRSISPVCKGRIKAGNTARGERGGQPPSEVEPRNRSNRIRNYSRTGNGTMKKRVSRVINGIVKHHIPSIEMIGVIMRIISFSLVSWLGPESPFLFVWIFNSVDAVMLAWCSILKKDRAYTLLNIFWIVVGIIGILRVSGIIRA
jgi:hypothetical protein